MNNKPTIIKNGNYTDSEARRDVKKNVADIEYAIDVIQNPALLGDFEDRLKKLAQVAGKKRRLLLPEKA